MLSLIRSIGLVSTFQERIHNTRACKEKKNSSLCCISLSLGTHLLCCCYAYGCLNMIFKLILLLFVSVHIFTFVHAYYLPHVCMFFLLHCIMTLILPLSLNIKYTQIKLDELAEDIMAMDIN